jgi:hypothetical protein
MLKYEETDKFKKTIRIILKGKLYVFVRESHTKTGFEESLTYGQKQGGD